MSCIRVLQQVSWSVYHYNHQNLALAYNFITIGMKGRVNPNVPVILNVAKAKFAIQMANASKNVQSLQTA